MADRSSNWRMFKAVDGLHETPTAAVSVSPRGNVWVKHSNANEISVLDGYRIQTMPSPGQDSYRVYESRTGQLWSWYPAGLVVYAANQWVQHPVPEIQARLQADPLREMRQIPLVPAERDRVLFLLADRLMEYDATAKRAIIVKHVSETGLGRFLELAESRDGGTWVTGARGALKLPGPVRHLRAGVSGQEFLVEPALRAENLQRPFEDSLGALTVVAGDSQAIGQRLILRLEEGRWRVQTAQKANLRQAWTAWDQTIWAYTPTSLLRFDSLSPGASTRERIWIGQYKDVATETNGVFWLATTEGLLRYAPYIWRTPVELEELTSHVHGMVEDEKGRFWLASSDSLVRQQAGQTRPIRWPEGVEGSFQSGDALYDLPDGRLAIAAGERSLLFDPETDHFQMLSHPSGEWPRVLGQFPGGDLVVQVRPVGPNETGQLQLQRFDGRTFEPLVESPPTWNLGGELSFVAPLSNGDVWIGVGGVLARCRGSQMQVFGVAEGLREATVLCLAETKDGKLWCGGTDRIHEFNGGSWSVLRTGFDRVNAIVRTPNDRIWVASARGIYSYAKGSWVHHGIEEGLPSIGISALLTDGRGQLWAGTTRGVSRYHPDADVSPPKTLPPIFEDAKGLVTGESATVLLNGIDKWQQTPGDRILFATRLDAGPWSPYSNIMVKSLDQLAAGRHRLEIRAMDSNWNEDPELAALEFSVVLAWYQDPRLIGSVISGSVLVLFFAAVAANRHRRLIRSYAEVERIVAIRTRQLERANQALLQSQKMQALGTLAASIAHDFNNILSIIKGSAQIIQSNLDDKTKILTRVDRIQAVVEQGSGIVKSILGLSRVKDKDLVPADLNEIVANTVKLMSDRFAHELVVRFHPEPSLPSVLVAKDLVEQMLLNLILNAADAMEHRGKVILSTGQLHHVRADLALPPARASSYLYVSVQDSGSGIDPEILPRIFEPFFTTKALSARRGTGLGLSIVYELARQMGYGIEVKSTSGKGSTFTILLPLRENA